MTYKKWPHHPMEDEGAFFSAPTEGTEQQSEEDRAAGNDEAATLASAWINADPGNHLIVMGSNFYGLITADELQNIGAVAAFGGAGGRYVARTASGAVECDTMKEACDVVRAALGGSKDEETEA